MEVASVDFGSSIPQESSPGLRSSFSRSDGSRLPTGRQILSGRSSPGWAIRFALDYFGLADSAVAEIANRKGRDSLLEAWRRSGAGIYHMPEFVLRQEWFHGLFRETHRLMPEEFFDAIGHGTILDWGCGTAEAERLAWIDRGGETILADLPGPNFKYTRDKYEGFNARCFPLSFDLIDRPDGLICIDVLEHVERPLEVARALWDRLKPGGFALFLFEHAFPHPGHILASIRQIPAFERWLRKSAIIHSQEFFDFVEKPRRWWRLWH